LHNDIVAEPNAADVLASEPSVKHRNEQQVAAEVRDVLARHLSPDYEVQNGRNILYKIEVGVSGRVSHEVASVPRRGHYAFQTDILIAKESLPLVVVELKLGSFSTHDVITYSWKAERHKRVYPYLRYGFVVVGLDTLGRRFVTHNEGFDFAMALSDPARIEPDLVPLVQRQITGAERIINLMRSSRIRLRRYEQTVEIEQ
jgi:hypothetical protein